MVSARDANRRREPRALALSRSMILTRRLLDYLTDLCLRHSRGILTAAGIIALLSIAAAATLRFDADLLNLVPQQNKEVNDFRRVLEEMGTIDYHIVVISVPEGQDPGDYQPLVDRLAAGYEASPLFRDVTWQIPNPIDLVEEILPRAFLFLSPEELEAVRQKLTDEAIRESVTRNRQLLQTPQGMAMKEVVQYDPFNLLPIFMEKFRAAGGGFRIDAASGYYLSEDRTTFLVLTRPVKPAQDVPFSQQIMATAAEIETAALAESGESSEPPAPRIDYTGGYAIAQADADLIRQDVISNVLFSVFGVLAVFLYGFRRLAALGYAALPLLLALAITFGTAALVYGELSSLSAGFAALLAGLGIDFIMVFYGRYVDERNRGAAMPEAIRTTIRAILPALTIAAATTAGTFFGFLATDFAGMTQLGLLTGVGILFFFVSVVLVLPALLVQAEKKDRPKPPTLHHSAFGSAALIRAAMRSPGMTIVIWIVLGLGSVVAATQIDFSDNLQNLRARGNAGIVTQERLTEKFGQSFDFMMYVIEGDSIDGVLAETAATLPSLERLRNEGVIASYQSIATFVPPVAAQTQTIETLRAGADDAFSVSRIESTFRDALEENGFVTTAWDEYLALFRQTLSPQQPIDIEGAATEALESLTGRFIHETPRGWMSVVYLYPGSGVWPRSVPPELLELEREHPGTVLTGVNRVSEVLRGIVRSDAIRATLVSTVLVFVLMYIGLRNLRDLFLSFTPFVAGVTCMLGAMAVLGLEFNFMNVFVGVMIVGVATDYAIYMISRYREDPLAFELNAEETGKAVVMAAITSIVGYGSFALSHYPGLQSIGYASLFGVGFSGLASITLLPAILVLVGRKHHATDANRTPSEL